MSKKMLINATHPEENRVAIVDDGILTELDIEIAGKEQTRGNIYQAVVVRVEPGLQAAFIDYGGERFGFLQMGEVHPSYFRQAEGNGEKNRYPRITDVLRRGQELLVQIVKEERGTKGAALTTYLSLPGRFMVLMPESDTKGVSRKIEDEGQRKKLKEAMASLDLPQNMGYIVRTAGIGQKKEELRRDFNYLVRVYEKIREHSRQAKAPSLIYKESNLVIRSLRDYFSADMDEVLVDDPRVCQEAKDFFQEVMPEYARLVKLHLEKRPIFARYQIEEQIETITKNKVPLPSGGSIVIDATEALVAIDVNSGKMAGEQGVEATAYKTNLEAAAESARQLRLRDLGGLIVIDFIDMRDRKHIREIEKCLKDSLKYDKARVTVGRISQFGLLEMSRQRIKATLAEGAYLPCPHCSGSGRVKSAEAQGIAFLRKVHAAVAKGQIGRVEGEIPLDVATYLLNAKREELLEMERQNQISILIKGRPDFLAGQVELTVQKREKEDILVDLQPALAASIPLPLPTLLPETTPEIPPEPMETPAEAEGETSQATEGEAGKKKRKRKRRKKKPEEIPASAPMETAAAASEPAGPEPETAEPLAVEPESGAASDFEESAAAGESRDERKKKRRRRRKKKPAGPAEITAEEQALAAAGAERMPAPETEPSTPALEESVQVMQEQEAAEPTRTPRKRRRGRKKAVEAMPAPEMETAEEAKPSPAAEPEPVQATESSPAAEPATTADTALAAEAPKKRKAAPRRKTTGKTVEKKAEPQSGPPEAGTATHEGVPEKPLMQEAPAVLDTAEATDRPKRRAPRKKAPPREKKAEETASSE